MRKWDSVPKNLRSFTKNVATHEQEHFTRESDKVAIRDNIGTHTYGQISERSNKVAKALSSVLTSKDNSNIAFLTPNNNFYSVAQLGIWKSGFSCVPLCQSHPPDSLRYYLEDSKSSTLIVTREFSDKV